MNKTIKKLKDAYQETLEFKAYALACYFNRDKALRKRLKEATLLTPEWQALCAARYQRQRLIQKKANAKWRRNHRDYWPAYRAKLAQKEK